MPRLEAVFRLGTFRYHKDQETMKKCQNIVCRRIAYVGTWGYSRLFFNIENGLVSYEHNINVVWCYMVACDII